MDDRGAKRKFMIAGIAIDAPALVPALYLVSTPIGNLSDITLRALQTMAGADILACEDTRTSRILLARYGIARRLVAYHEHNAGQAGPRLLSALAGGRSVALISDAGTPLISDPGYRLVEGAIKADVQVVPVPGPSAPLAALSASGLPTDAFFFSGFLPSRASQRDKRLAALKDIAATLVFFESPRRLAASLASMVGVLGAEREGCVAREITKRFEDMRRGPLGDLAAHFAGRGAPKGELVVCVGPPVAGQPDAAAMDRMLLQAAERMSASGAAAEVARTTGARKSELYRRLMALRQGDDAG